jgi:hypothetical protein
MVSIDSFYGITTTTLVVLSSTTLAVFQFLSSTIVKKAEFYNEKLTRLINQNGVFNTIHKISPDARKLLNDDFEKLQNNYREIKEPLLFEIMVLFAVIFLAAVSIFIVLFNGAFVAPRSALVSTNTILKINFFAISLFIGAFCAFLGRISVRRQKILSHGNNVDEFIKKVDIIDDAKFKK